VHLDLKAYISLIKVFCLSFCSVIILSCTKSTNEEASKRTVLFEDEFDQLSLDTASPPTGLPNWATYYVGWNVHHLIGNNDQCYKTFFPRVSQVLHETTGVNSTIKLYGVKTPVTDSSKVEDFPYMGGMLSLQVHHPQLFGYWEVKARFNISKSQHWGIWLVQSNNQGPHEIDMVEVVGNGINPITNVYMTQHGSPNDYMTTVSNVTIDQFHIYGFEWTSTYLAWYLDGAEIKKIPNYIHSPMYLMITPEIANNWAGAPDSTTQWPTICELDYVRIYDKK
jgi:Glycosyl hydrolases family 16